MSILHTYIPSRVIDDNGIADGATLTFYLSGTNTLTPVYADAALTTPLTNPVVVPSGAEVPTIYLDEAIDYRRVVTYSDGSTEDIDPYEEPFGQEARIVRADLADPTKGATLVKLADGNTVQDIQDEDKGAGLLKFRHAPAAPYISGTVGDRLNRTVYITDAPYSAAAGGPDITTPLISAVNSGASEIVLPSIRAGSIFEISDTIELPAQVTIRGQSPWATIIRSSALDQPIFYGDGAAHVTLSCLGLRYNGTPVAGADAIWADDCQFWNIDQVWIVNSWNGFRATDGGGNHAIENFRSFDYGNSGFQLEGPVIDVSLAKFKCFAGDSIKGASGGITLIGGVEAFSASQGHCALGAAHGLNTAGVGGSTARGSAPYFNRFSEIFFDSTKGSPAYLRQAAHTDFASCWFASSGHDEAVGFSSALNVPGIDVSACTHIRFAGGDCYNNGGYGALLYSDSKFITFDQMGFKRNHFSRGANGPAIQVLAPATDWAVRDCQFERDADTTTYRQSEAVNVQGGASDRYFIRDNLLGGCTVVDGGTGVNKSVANNY